MALPKIIEIIYILETKKSNSLRKFIASRLSIEADTMSLYDYIVQSKYENIGIENMIDFHSTNFKHISYKSFSNLFSQLYLLAEAWIALDQLESEPYSKDIYVQKWLNKHGFYNYAEQSSKRLSKLIGLQPSYDLAESKAKSEMLNEQLFSSSLSKYDLNASDFTDMIEAFDEYVAGQYLLFLSELKNREEVSNIDFASRRCTILTIIDHIPDSPIKSLLQPLYAMIADNDVNAFDYLKTLLLTNKIKVGSNLHSIICNHVIKKSVRFWAKGLLPDHKIISKLTKYGLDAGIYFNHTQKIATHSFHNLIIQLCVSLTYKEMLAFINKWINHVNTDHLEATKGLAIAQVKFYNEKYDLHQLTWRSDYDNFNQVNLARGLHLIACFENRKKEIQMYKNALQTSIYFIQRNRKKMSAHLYDSNMNFIDIIKKIDAGKVKEIKLENYNAILYRKYCQSLVTKK